MLKKARPKTETVQFKRKMAKSPAPDCRLLRKFSKGGIALRICINVLATQKKIQHESIKMILLKAPAGSCICQKFSLTDGKSISESEKGYCKSVMVLVTLIICYTVIDKDVYKP